MSATAMLENAPAAAFPADSDRVGWALHMASLGFRVLPLASNGKTPVPKFAWPEKATTDPQQIRTWMAKGYNYGLVTGEPMTDGRYSLVLDVDMKLKAGKLEKNGEASLVALCKATGTDLALLVKSLRQQTPGGQRDGKSHGGHILTGSARPLGGGVDKLGPGLDVKAHGGYIVGPGSSIDGKLYRLANPDAAIIDLPESLAIALEAPDTRTAERAPVASVDPDRAEQRAAAYLRTAPVSIEGQGGDDTAYRVACKLKDMDCTADVALRLMLDHWNDRCTPPWAYADLFEKVQHAYRYGKEPQGVRAPEKVFEKVPTTDSGDDEADHPLAVVNQTHAFVLIGGAGYVLWETTDDRGTPCVEFLQLTTFHQLMAAKTLQTGKRSEPLTQAWMAWPERRTYRGVTFAPGRDLPAGYFNLWHGFAVTPKLGDWSLMRAHIRKVVCGGDPLLDHYVMGWLARMIQQPGERGEVALVLRGRKGTGKGTLGDWLLRIFGRHGTHIVNAKHLVGNFNKHLQEAAFLFADEAFWAGDKQHEGVLKALITERTLMIEAKGKDAVPRDNCLHILMASNSDWVVPASAEERRYCVVDVSDVKMQNHDYFGKLAKQRDAGGLAAMLFDLQRYDLTGFQVREVPSTKALGDQKLHGLTGAARWLHDVLARGEVDSMSRWGDGELAVQKTQAFSDYCQRSQRLYREHHPQDEREFWKQVRAMMKGTTFRDVRLPVGDSRPRAAVFPDLAEARAAFARHLRSDLDWSQGQDDADLDALLS